MNIEKKALAAIEKGLFTSWNIPLQNYTQNEHELFNSDILIRCRLDVAVTYESDFIGFKEVGFSDYKEVSGIGVFVEITELYFSETCKNMVGDLSHESKLIIDNAIDKVIFNKLDGAGDWISEDKIHWND